MIVPNAPLCLKCQYPLCRYANSANPNCWYWRCNGCYKRAQIARKAAKAAATPDPPAKPAKPYIHPKSTCKQRLPIPSPPPELKPVCWQESRDYWRAEKHLGITP